MTELEKAARLALEALEYYQVAGLATTRVVKSITALRQALSNSVEQPQDEWLTGCPECGMDGECGCDKQPAQHDYRTKYDRPCYKCRSHFCPGNCKEPEHLQQPAQQKPVDWEAVAADQAMTIAMMKAERKPWVALTDEERRGIPEWQKIQEELGPVWAPMMLYLYLAIEAKLREKNAGGQA